MHLSYSVSPVKRVIHAHSAAETAALQWFSAKVQLDSATLCHPEGADSVRSTVSDRRICQIVATSQVDP